MSSPWPAGVSGGGAPSLPGGGRQGLSLTPEGALRAALVDPATAFGEIKTAEVRPLVQFDAVYGLRENVRTATETTGAVSTDSTSRFVCSTGAGAAGLARIQGDRSVRYRPGLGAIFRWTSVFDPGASGSRQLSGPFSKTDGFIVGRDGTSFGVMHRSHGLMEIRTLTISAAASGAETALIQLDGVTYNVPVTAGTTAHNAFEIEQWFANPANQTAWNAYQNASTVRFVAVEAEARAGAYSISVAAGTFAGSLATQATGVAPTELWIPRADFSEDLLDGAGPSGFDITDKLANGNVFAAAQQYLGFGAVAMRIEEPDSGRFFTFHRFKFAGSRPTPTVGNPTLMLGWEAANEGNTSDIVLRGASAMGGIQGRRHAFGPPFSHVFTRSIAGVQKCVFSIRVREEIDGRVALAEVFPSLFTGSVAGTKTGIFQLALNPVFDYSTLEHNWQFIDETNSFVQYDETAADLSSPGRVLTTFVVFGGTSDKLLFSNIDYADDGTPIHLGPGEVLSVLGRVVGGAGDNMTGSLTWLED